MIFNKKRKPRQRKIASSMISFYIVVNSVLLMLFGVFSVYSSVNSLEKEVTDYTKKTLEQATIILDQNLTDIQSKMILLTSYKSVLDCLTPPIHDYTQILEAERNTAAILRNIDLFKPVINDVFIIGNNGYVNTLYLRDNLVSGYDYQAQWWYQEAVNIDSNANIKILGLHIQDYYKAEKKPNDFDQYTISVSMAVKNPNNNSTVGAIISTLDLEQLGIQLMSSNYEQSGKIALLDENNTIVGQNDNTRIGETFTLSEDNQQNLTNNKEGVFHEIIDGEKFLLCFNTSEVCDWKLVSYIPMREIQRHSDPIQFNIILFLAVCLVCNAAIAYLFSRSIKKPMAVLIQNIEKVDENNLSMLSENYSFVELSTIVKHFNELLLRLDVLIKQDYISHIELNRFQLWALQSQINPHFLFNTLQLLQTEIICNNPQSSNEIVVSLSRLLRYTMHNSTSEVSLKEEMEYIQDYLLLFIKKYDGELSVEYALDEEAQECLVPKIILQPFVENCLKHAFSDDPHDAVICITTQIKGDLLVIKIRDNGKGISQKSLNEITQSLSKNNDDKNGIGLSNVQKRIQMIFGKQYGIKLSSGNGVTEISIEIPRKFDR